MLSEGSGGGPGSSSGSGGAPTAPHLEHFPGMEQWCLVPLLTSTLGLCHLLKGPAFDPLCISMCFPLLCPPAFSFTSPWLLACAGTLSQFFHSSSRCRDVSANSFFYPR